jgi:hypothetical protein
VLINISPLRTCTHMLISSLLCIPALPTYTSRYYVRKNVNSYPVHTRIEQPLNKLSQSITNDVSLAKMAAFQARRLPRVGNRCAFFLSFVAHICTLLQLRASITCLRWVFLWTFSKRYTLVQHVQPFSTRTDLGLTLRLSAHYLHHTLSLSLLQRHPRGR